MVDGYWLLVEPLAPGPHVLRTGGRFRGVPFFQPHEIVANITVLPANRPPVADAGGTGLRVISVDRTGAAVVLDGSRSFDPDGDALTFDWVEHGATIARGAIATRRFRAGAHAISLVVSDGSLKSTNSFVIQMITAGHAIHELIRAVENVPLPRNGARQLVSELVAARNAVDQGRFEPAIHHLKVFQKKVHRHLAGRDPAVAKVLHESAQEIIAALEARSK